MATPAGVSCKPRRISRVFLELCACGAAACESAHIQPGRASQFTSLMPAADSLAGNCLPLGLAHGWKVLRAVAAGTPLKWSDVAFDANSTAVRVRREMEQSMNRKERERVNA